MLKTINVDGYGPYVCGRKPSQYADSVQRFSATPAALAAATKFSGIDSIRAAATKGPHLFVALENILANDSVGDCAIAAAMKIQAINDCLAGREMRMPTVDDALWLYSQCSGPPAFNPETRANDNGCELLTVLQHWQANGLYKDGYGKIKEFFAVDATKPDDVRSALTTHHALLGGCLLPKQWEQIRATGFTWPMDGEPDPDAGHATYQYGFNDPCVFDGTWGMEGSIPWDAVAYYFGAQNGGELYTVVAA